MAAGGGDACARPRVLVTGFEAFPGAPVNPTEALAERMGTDPPLIGAVAAFRAALLPVDYRRIGPALSDLGAAFVPDIAVHFGLAAGCRGFRLERQALNRLSRARPDNAGYAPEDGPVCAGPPSIAARLPLAAIAARLEAAGLPVEWSDDAGGYLCNVAMTLSLAGACAGFTPSMSGFVHVPPTGQGAALEETALDTGAALILGAAVEAWNVGQSLRMKAGRMDAGPEKSAPAFCAAAERPPRAKA